jgi:hypothetical protein
MEARYDERLRECKTPDEMAEYLLSCMTVIREYTTTESIDNLTETKKVANLTISSRKGVPRKDIYKKYLLEVENEHTDAYIEKEHFTKPCAGCGNFYTKFLENHYKLLQNTSIYK